MFVRSFLFIIVTLWTSTETSTNVTSVISESAVEMKNYFETSSSVILDTLKRMHGLDQYSRFPESQHRRRRAVPRLKHVYDDRGVYRLMTLEPMFPACRHNSHISLTRWNDLTYAVCISNQREAAIGFLNVSGWFHLDSWNVGQAQDTVLFHTDKFLYAMVADQNKAEGTDLLGFNFNQTRMEVDHTIHSRYPTAITLWRMQPVGGDFHLAIANSHGPGSTVFQDYTYTYDWRGTYFDHYHSVRSYDVRDLEAYNIYGHAYLAVANHKSASGIYDVDSEIFRFDIDQWRWKSFQKIRTQAVSDVHFFEMGPVSAKETFFVVANQFEQKYGKRNYAIDSVIYKFFGGRFVPFQCIRTHGASGVSAYSDTLTGAFLLAVSNLFSPVQLYQYDGWKFVTTEVQSGAENMGPGAAALAFLPWKGFTAENQQLALVVSNPGKDQETTVFALSFSSQYSLRQMYSEGIEWCTLAEQRLNKTRTSEMVDILKRAPFSDKLDSLVLQGPVTFQGGLSLEGALQTPKLVDVFADRETDYSLLFQLQSLQHRLFTIKNRITNLKRSLNIACRTSGDQIIEGQMKFESLSASCPSGNVKCQIPAIDTSFVNGQNVEDLQARVVFLEETNTVAGSLAIKELIVQGNILVEGYVDGINVSHVVTRNSNNIIHSQKTFAHTLVASNINVKGTMDTVEISERAIMLTQGNQEVYGDATFTEIEVEDIVIDGTIGGINLYEFYEDVILVNSVEQRVTGQKSLKGPVTFHNLHLETGRINGVDLVDLWNNAVWLDMEQLVHVPWNFSGLALINPEVSAVNGIEIPGPQIPYPVDRLEVLRHQRFMGDVDINKLEVQGSLNGFDRIQSHDNDCSNQLNMLLKNCDQVIYGTKTFGTLTLGGHSHVSGPLNGFNLYGLSKKLSHKALNLSGNWIFNQVDIRAPVLVKGDLIGWQVQELYQKALKVDQQFSSNAVVTFKNQVQVEHLSCKDLNGVDIQRDLFLRQGNTIVTEKKQWDNLVLLENAKAMGTINALNINFLRDVLRNGPEDQVLLENRIIEGDLIVNSLDLGGKLSGLDLVKTINLNKDNTFKVPVQLENVSVERELFAGSLVVASGQINNQHFLHTLNNTMIHNLPQQVLGQKIIIGEVIVPEHSNLEVKVASGVNLRNLQKDTLYQEVPQLITGKKTFLGPTRFQNLLMNGSINGISVWELFNNFLLQDVQQTISANVHFDGGLKVDGVMNIAGHVNGIDISALEQDIIHKGKPFHIRGTVVLESAQVLRNINLTGKIQGIDLSEEAVRMFSDNIIIGRKVFRNMLIDGDLLVDGFINGIHVPDLCQFTARQTHYPDFNDVVVHGNVRALDLLTVATVNDIIVHDFRESVVLLNESHKFRDVIFREVIFEQAIILDGLLNGIHLQQLDSNYMSLSQDQDVLGKVIFKNPISIKGNLHVDNMKIANQMIGNIDVVHLAHHLLTRLGEQEIISKYIIQGNLILTSDLTGSTSINGLSFPDDVAIKSRPNTVSSPVKFERDFIVTSDLELLHDTFIQQVDVSVWASQTIMTTGHFTLTGVKRFKDLHLQDVRALDLFGGTLVSMSTILLKKGDQHFKGKVSFGGEVKVIGSLDAFSEINGIHVPKLLEEAVLQNQPSIITGHKVFISPLSVSRLSTVGFVARVNVTELSLLVRRPYDIELLKSQMIENVHSVALFDDFLIDGPRSLNYYEEWFRLEIEQLEVLAWDYLDLHDSTQLLIVSWKVPGSQDCSKLVTYAFVNNAIIEIAVLPSSYAVKVQIFSVNSVTYLAVANAHGLCNAEAGGVHIYTLDPEKRVWSMVQILTTLPSSDLSVLLDNPNFPCIASVLHDLVLIHCFDKNTNSFAQHQDIMLPGVFKVSFTTCQEKVFLASTVFQSGVWSAHVFIWTGPELILLQVLPANYPIAGPLLIGSVDKVGSQLCLLVLPEGGFGAKYSSQTAIYRFNTKQNLFLEDLRLPVRNVISVQLNRLSSSEIILSLLAVDGVYIYRWSGLPGFVFYDFFNFFGGKNLLGFNTRDHHYLAVSGLACELSWWQSHNPINTIFTARIKGA